MKFSADRKSLEEIVSMAARVCPGKTPNAAYEYVMLEASKGGVRASGTNGAISISGLSARADVHETGKTLVLASKFRGVLSELVNETVDVALTEDFVGVSTPRAKFRISKMPSDKGYIRLEVLPVIADATIPSNALRVLIASVRKGSDTLIGSTYSFPGIGIEADGNALRFIATEGRRLHISEEVLVNAPKTTRAVILPMDAVGHLMAVLPETDEMVRFTANESAASFTTETMSFVCGTLEQKMVPYLDHLPRNNKYKMTVPVEELKKCVRQARLFNTEETKGVLISVSSAGCVVSVPGVDDAPNIEVEKVEYQGEPETFCLSNVFLADALSSSPSEICTIEGRGGKNPVLFTSGNLRCVLCVMKMPGEA